MDPDVPQPSIERDGASPRDSPFLQASLSIHGHHHHHHQHPHQRRQYADLAASVALPASSPVPVRTPIKSPLNQTKSLSPRPPSRAASVASHRSERQSTPSLVTRRSTSSLRGATPNYRRASSHLNPSSPLSAARMGAVAPEKPPVTASSVAKEFFTRELEAHPGLQSHTIVIVHDACYGHRFSRPRTSKNALATIVERPERIQATLLGASAAYVRLGGRHTGGACPPRQRHHASNVRDVPFQIRKTTRVLPLNHPSVTFVHGTKWMEELQVMCDSAEGKLALNGKELVRPIGYGKDENGNPLPKLHEGDLYLCAESLAALQGCLGGVCDAVDTVFSSNVTKRAFVCIRPPGHHCSDNFPSGFCWLNNVHVGISYAAMNHGLTHAAIIDFDLHHGDGSQNITWAHNARAQTLKGNAAAHKKTPIGYYSLHDINSYPCEWGDKEKVQNASLCIENAHGQSIWNVHLEPWNSLEDFWNLYESRYLILVDKARSFLRSHAKRLRAAGAQPKGAIFISAGFDASEWEGAGMQRHSVNVPTEFYARFTKDLVELSREEDLGVDGRLISVLEGGYSDRALTTGALSHICGLTADKTAGKDESEPESTPQYGTITSWIPEPPSMVQRDTYKSEWWALHNLEELEAVVAGRQPPPPKGPEDKSGNFASPTHASTAKMTDGARDRHSLSALQARLALEANYVPPPPDVEWSIAAYELSRVIIPSDRQTTSCTHEELNAEATKARRERQSTIGLPGPPEEKMQLRTRATRAAASAGVRVPSRTDRRTTIAAISDLPDPSLQNNVNGRPRRRSSDASSILSSFQGMKISDENAENAVKAPSNRSSNAPSRAASTAPEKPGKAVAVKKTRASPAPVVSKPVPKPKPEPRKPKVVPATLSARTPTENTGLPTLPEVAVNSSGDQAIRQASGSTQGSDVKAEDVDNGAVNGTKRISIKLKMPTAEEHAAKQSKLIEEKQKKARTTKKPTIPRPVTSTYKTLGSTNGDKLPAIAPKPAPAKASAVGPITPTDVRPTAPGAQLPDRQEPTREPSLPQFSPVQQFQTFGTASAVQAPHQPLPHQPLMVAPPLPPQMTSSSIVARGDETPQVMAFHPPAPQVVNVPIEHAQFTSATAPVAFPTQQPGAQPGAPPAPRLESGPVTPFKPTRQDLPVFTSTSPIPFGAPRQSAPVPQQPSIWDIPETPQGN